MLTSAVGAEVTEDVVVAIGSVVALDKRGKADAHIAAQGEVNAAALAETG